MDEQRSITRGVRSGVFLLALVLLTITALAQPPSQHPLFISGEAGYDTYRIPALAITPKGTLLAFCEGRKDSGGDSGNIDLIMRRSTDHGTTWEPMRVIADDGTNTCGNPCPIVDRKTGNVVLLITKNIGSEKEAQIMKGEASPRTVWVTTSTDDGLTWSTPMDISAQAREPSWRWYATGPGHGIQLADGRMIAPCDHSTSPLGSEMYSHVLFSDDAGATWHIGGSTSGWTDESTALELADGSLYLNMRNSHKTKRRLVSRSADRGMTWAGPVEDPTLVEPTCQASVLRLSTEKDHGKNRVLFSNPAHTERKNMTVRLSYDECMTWPIGKTLWEGPAAYSDLVVTADNMIGCLYERGNDRPYETITFARFTLDWFTDGADRF